MVILIASAVKYLAEVRTLSGPEKKELAIRTVRDVISESDLESEAKNELLSFVDLFADETVEQLVDFGKQAYLKIRARGCPCRCPY